MTTQEQLSELLQRRDELHRKIVNATRPVIAVLKDSGRMASAAPLQELFFELDALDEEMLKFTSEKLGEIIAILRKR